MPRNPKAAGPPTDIHALQDMIVEILDGNALMSLATLRDDGWPQATVVTYLRDGRNLCFIAARESQKVANITRDPRVSVTVIDAAQSGGAVRALSMAARVSEITDAHRVGRINRLIHDRSAGARFTPHPSNPNIVVLEARPEVISLVDYTTAPGLKRLVRVVDDWRVELVTP